MKLTLQLTKKELNQTMKHNKLTQAGAIAFVTGWLKGISFPYTNISVEVKVQDVRS